MFDELAPGANLALFAAGAAAIWLAGSRLARYADAIAERTGAGRALIGALLLGGITSLPEGATTATAAAIGNAPLAVNNLLGGVAMQVALLAVADLVVPGRAISVRIREPVVMLQAAFLVLVLAIVAATIAVGEVGFLGVGVGSAGVLAVSLLAFHRIHADRAHATWEPEEPERRERGGEDERNPALGLAPAALGLRTALAALVILAAGYVVASTGDALAEQTGLGASFVGVLLVAVATSLPEASTTLAAARMGRYGMAFSNVFGANILDLSLLFLADALFRGGPVLAEVGRFSLVGALLGILVSGVYLVGMLQRRRRVVLGMGIDSLAVLALYACGMYVLYTLR